MGTPAQIRVGYPGGKYSFSEAAVTEYFKRPHVKTGAIRPFRHVPCDTFKLTVERFHNGYVDEILVPIRNNNSRQVLGMQKMLRDVNGEVAGEHYHYVEQCALANLGVTLENVSKAWSMGPAIEQTELFIKGRKLSVDFKDDTAGAALELKKKDRRDTVAIASPQAGMGYDLVNFGCVNDNEYSFTHFLHIVKKRYNKFSTPDTSRDKECLTKIILHGNLHPTEGTHPYQVFTRNGVQTSNFIDADRGTFDHRAIIFDMGGHLHSPLIRKCFKELDELEDRAGSRLYKREIMGCFLANPAPPVGSKMPHTVPVLEWW